jgi:putative endonuclease
MHFYVYILSNPYRTIYTGVTNNLERRLWEHIHGPGQSFTKRYGIRRLVYVERHHRAIEAIAREKQIKGWKRCRKVELIESMNPDWKDLIAEWFPPGSFTNPG